MIDALFSQPNYVAVKKMLDTSLMRHEAISSNLANLDTPNYKRLDVAPSFESQLQQAVSAGDPNQISSLQPQLSVDKSAVCSRSDGNTVELESELLQLNKNTLENTVETQLVTASLAKLRLAITGKN
ncbi:MAG TPA: flagellar basal body protein [Verrucomicrobiae bacterium]|jgi:flagellar basal-body rod protein FlgB|nr:flagellar basal body protein [Verrucomicrobiae bacterium]